MPKLPEGPEVTQTQQRPISEDPEFINLVPRMRRERISTLFMQRWSMEDIAKELSIPVKQVEAEIGHTKENWKRRRMLLDADRIEEELAHMEAIREECYKMHYEAKKGKVVSERVKELEERVGIVQMDGTVSDGLIDSMRRLPGVKLKRKRESQTGDLAALRLALDTSTQIRKLLGVDAPEVKKLNIEQNVNHTYDFGQLVQLEPAKLAELHRRAIEESTASQQQY